MSQRRSKELFKGGGVVLNVNFKKYFFALISTLTLYVGNVSNLPPSKKKGGGGGPTPPPPPTPPFLRPYHPPMARPLVIIFHISQNAWFNSSLFLIRLISVFVKRYFYLEEFEGVKMNS